MRSLGSIRSTTGAPRGSATSGTSRRRWWRTASATALTVLVGTVVVLAYRYDGKPFTEVDLNDGGVWVTNTDLGLVARLNPQIKELDLGVDPGTATFDIFQRATSLYVDDEATSRAVRAIDIPKAAVQEPTAVPTGAVVVHGGDTFAVVDYVSGKAWVRPESQLSAFNPKTTPPDTKEALSATVGDDGRAYILGRDGTVTPFTTAGAAPAQAQDTIDLGDGLGSDPKNVDITVVGQTPVVLDRQSMELRRPGQDPVTVEAADAAAVKLQQPSALDDDIYVATSEGLQRIPVEGGELTRASRGPVAGTPAAPVVLAQTGCVYAAWADPSSPNNFLRDCPGDGDGVDDFTKVDNMAEGASLVFRVNRDVVVLNDVTTGDSWIVQEPGKAKVNNWPQVDPKNENRSKQKEITEERPDQENRPPEPQPDDLGARPGRSTVLPVVALNDFDPDGDIISISKTQHVRGPELETRIVGGGTQLQVTVPAGATGTSVLKYFVTDGKVNDERSAEVRVTIRDQAAHVKPKQMEKRKPELRVAKGATASYYLLADFYDYDGDDLTLSEVSARGGDVESRPDGTITFTDTGKGAKVTEINYVITDGYDELTGKLPVTVLADKSPPELIPDLASGVAGTRVVVQPLANDRNPEGKNLTLKNVKVMGDDRDTELTFDPEAGTFTFLAKKARSYYLQYSAYNSSATATSEVRLDIESPPKDNREPIAVRDKAVVATGGTTQVDLLLNDLDPDNDVLVVKRIGRSANPGVKVSLVDKRLAVVTSSVDIGSQPIQVDYTVSDGRRSVPGSLVISQRSAAKAKQHPVANKDQVTVRAGSVTTVPVLANDTDPDGSKPRLFQSDLINADDLDVWVSGDTLRLRAPDKPGTYSVIYGVRDDDGLKSSAELSVFVVPDSAKNNRPPLPQPIIDRVIAGRPKVISVDLVGADPDGDSVAFRSILTAPSLGRVIETGVDYIRYEAFDGRFGTDFFQILVQDKYGATGVAEVRVGVVGQEAINQRPVALDDNVLVQPERTISYNVLTNDVDPDDDPLRVDAVNSTAKVGRDKGSLELTIGKAPTNGTAVTTVGYSISDVAGATDDAVLKVSASDDAPFYAPVARDDVADVAEIIGRKPGEKVTVPVLDNDLDFDGAKADLVVGECDAGADGACEVDGDQVQVTLKATDQVVLYQLDDADEESTPTFGVIYVTGTENVPPQLTTDTGKVPVKVDADTTKDIDLTDIVVTRAGRSVALAPDVAPLAINGSVGPVPGEPASVRFTPVRGYVGSASITLTVTDDRGEGDKSALTALLTVPIDVVPTENVAPTMRDAAVDVGIDDDPVEVDLAGLTRDANKDDLESMTWTAKASGDAVDASIEADSDVMVVKAGGSAKAGDTVDIAVTADDGNGGTTTAKVTARVVDSDRPLVRVPLIAINADENTPTRVDIADYAVNPYPSEPLTVSNPTIEGSGRLGGLGVDGSVVRFTPTTSGTSTLRVRVGDASGERSREVTARITVTVIDVPNAPDRPVLSSVEASSAVLSWREPDANGAPIEEYEVAGSNGYKQKCIASTCNLTNLTPGQAYTFTVRAKNSEGWSKPSPPTDEIVPNRAPDLMSPPTVAIATPPTGTRMDRQLRLQWEPPTNEGSPITAYEIKVAGESRVWQAGGSAREMVIPGLSNGTPYAFEIRAVNAVEPRREFSPPSQAVAPFGVPTRTGAPPLITASEASDYTADPFIKVEWSAWSDSMSNGNPVKSYTVFCSGCRRSSYVVDGSTTSKTFGPGDGVEKGKTITFRVAATNDAGTGAPGPEASGRPYTKPGPVLNAGEVGESPSDMVAKLGWDQPADLGGLPLSHYAVQIDNGSTQSVGDAPSGAGAPIRFAGNGTHSVLISAVTKNGNRLVYGEPVRVDNIDTWGKPAPPGSAERKVSYYNVIFDVASGAANGRPVTGVEWRRNNNENWQALTSGNLNEPVAQGDSPASFQVRTVSSAPDDGRKYSDVVTLNGTSLGKDLVAEVVCPFGGDCYLEVEAKGFRQTELTSSVDLGGRSFVGDAEKCKNPETKDGRTNQNPLKYRAGSGCKIVGSGTVRVTLDGVTDMFPN